MMEHMKYLFCMFGPKASTVAGNVTFASSLRSGRLVTSTQVTTLPARLISFPREAEGQNDTGDSDKCS